MALRLNASYTNGFISDDELKQLAPAVKQAHEALHNGTCAGNDFIGWLTLPTDYPAGNMSFEKGTDNPEFNRIKAAAKKIQSDSDILIVIGIGGSYLGARAAIEYLTSPNYNLISKKTPNIYYAGNSISGAALSELLTLCEGKDVSLNMISKSGTTTEPAVAFRVLRKMLEDKYGKEEACKRIYCTTDANKGTLHDVALKEGYETFVVPDDVGGRFSVLTAVGLLPIAVAGCDIDKLLEGAQAAQADFSKSSDIEENACYKYAAMRNVLYNKGYSTEILVSYEPAFQLMSEWWKQLYGESEGKDNKGLFPASVIFSTDLHSMGQYIQEGVRNLFETVCVFDTPKTDLEIGIDPENIDGLNFLAGEKMDYVNKNAFGGTVLAHNDGGVPNIVLEIPNWSEFELGYLIYFFEKACAISGIILGVNPFNQPGVEAYKKNMFALLGKPGYEKEQEALVARLGDNFKKLTGK
ncbi:MAG: glucose-6-phosphate isomerase [Ruminococcaceae bacterium]|nr:glucose-6-phosphate isomerase [Oscillospiraceae bacterium]